MRNLYAGFGKQGAAEIPFLHIFGQYSYHGEAHIRGNRLGLEALRDAITAALESQKATASEFNTDGEGYGLVVEHTEMISGLGEPQYLYKLEYEFGRAAAERDRDMHNAMARVRSKEKAPE